MYTPNVRACENQCFQSSQKVRCWMLTIPPIQTLKYDDFCCLSEALSSLCRNPQDGNFKAIACEIPNSIGTWICVFSIEKWCGVVWVKAKRFSLFLVKSKSVRCGDAERKKFFEMPASNMIQSEKSINRNVRKLS